MAQPGRLSSINIIDENKGRWQQGRLARGLIWALAMLVVLALTVSVAIVVSYEWMHADHIFPGTTTLDGLRLDSLTRQEAASALDARFGDYANRTLRLSFQDREWNISSESLGLRLETERVVDSAYLVGRQGNLWQQLADQFQALRFGHVVEVPIITVGQDKTAAHIASLAKEIDRPVIDARLVVDAQLRASVTPSQVGLQLNTTSAVRSVARALASLGDDTVDLMVAETPPSVGEAHLEPVRDTLNNMLSGPITLRFENRTWTMSREDIANWLHIDDLVKGPPGRIPELDDDALLQIARRLKDEIDQDPLKPRLGYNAGQVRYIREGRPGYKLDVGATVAAIKAQVATDNRSIALPVVVTTPAGLTGDRSAIKELVATASTSYAGSLPERSYNIELAASKLNGVVVGPDEIFSFNEELGPMTTQAGFKWGWGISQAQGEIVTIPSVAGGICQVSSTLFQSIFWAGYQIEERNWHLYWIERYGQPPTGLKGLDATVDQVYDANGRLAYAIDLKFKNTTPYPILIEARADGSRITFSLYSTKPNWEVKVDQPIIEDVVQADPTIVKQPDPSLPPGKQIWVEAAQDGFKSTIVRRVIEPGKEPRVLRMVSTYNPARNVVVEGPPASVQPAPDAAPTPNPVVPGQRPGER